VFDGIYIWVANTIAGTVSRLRAISGKDAGTFVVGFSPTGMAFDGANVWVANSGGGNVSKL